MDNRTKYRDGTEFVREFERRTEGFHVATGPAPGCPECLSVPERTCDAPDCYTSDPCGECERSATEDPGNDWYDLASEGSFSWGPCDTCGSSFGGNRFPAHLLPVGDGEYIHVDVCTDCIMYAANGDVPDVWYPSPNVARRHEDSA